MRNRFVVRVRWRDEDQLRWCYAFTVFPGALHVPDATQFHGNLVRVHHGLFRTAIFREPGELLAPDDLADPTKPVERYFERTAGNRYGLLCSLPHAPLSYLATPLDGRTPRSTLRVKIAFPGGSDP